MRAEQGREEFVQREKELLFVEALFQTNVRIVALVSLDLRLGKQLFGGLGELDLQTGIANRCV